MPDKKITDLTELTTPVSTDVLAIVDVAANITKKIQVGNLPGGSGGGVTDVTGTAPITSTRGTTPDIGITNATPSADGAMSAADKAKLDDIAITTPAAGEVLIYDSVAGVFENATLTQGTGISITNGDGSIEIAATGGGGGGVSSLETLTGALNLVGAGTVAVSDNGTDTITITGSGGSGGVSSLNALTGALDIQGLGTNTSVIASGSSIQITGNVVGDTTPQLGGNLDVQANQIETSTTNGNIALDSNGTGVVEVLGNQDAGGTNAGSIKLNCEQNTHGVTIKSPLNAATATYELTLPEADGTVANQPMVTDASGQLSFSGTVTANVAGQEINFNAGTATLSTDGDAEGTVVYFGNTNITAPGKVYTFFSGDWVAVDASVGGEDTTKGLLAMALGTTPATDGMLIQGIGILDHDPGSLGNILFVTNGITPGELTATQPSTADEYSRVVGHKIGTSKVLFTPSQDWIKIA